MSWPNWVRSWGPSANAAPHGAATNKAHSETRTSRERANLIKPLACKCRNYPTTNKAVRAKYQDSSLETQIQPESLIPLRIERRFTLAAHSFDSRVSTIQEQRAKSRCPDVNPVPSLYNCEFFKARFKIALTGGS